MMPSPVRLIELCLIAVVVLARASGPAAAKGRDHSYAYLGNGGNVTMSGDSKDVARARSFRQGGPLLWFREGGQEYVVRDPDTLAQFQAVWKSSRELDAAEDKLDRQHDDLDRKHDQLESRRDALESRRDVLADRESDLADRASDDSVRASERAELVKQRRELAQQRRALADEMRALEPPLKDLRAQIDAVQRQLEALQRQDKIVSAKEEVEVRALFRRAIAAGTARSVR